MPTYANLNTNPHLSPASGLALGNVDANPDVEIIGVLDDHANVHGGIIAFNLVGNALIPKWCSPTLPNFWSIRDYIPADSAPAIAELDGTGDPNREIIIDNKVFEPTGPTNVALKYTGWNADNNCSSAGGPCPRSRTPVVAKLTGPLPQVITGRGIYQSTNSTTWTGPTGSGNLPTIVSTVSNSSPGLTYPAVADLDVNGSPEIVVTDTMMNTVRVLSASGTQLTSALLPVPNCPGLNCPCPGANCPKCGGPPVIGDFDGVPQSREIGVASCTQLTVFQYKPSGPSLQVLWSVGINDPSGQATPILLNTPLGPVVYYADADNLWVLNGRNGNLIQCTQNTSATAIEGPVVATLKSGQPARIIVASNNIWNTSGPHGIRLFDTVKFGSRSFWNQHTYHWTNVTNSLGAIPQIEQQSWVSPGQNTYRSQ